ncbi:hypothetical protein Hamer_G001954 [Homarus americanus]|uniref:Uncharacterized protein n=1 Tax=Homarus americanus TaxID=6706 RepID=A0A8J5JVF8_HOMAM|nr:hypothetical protein Hamer_G001954 [Homarus americanus]
MATLGVCWSGEIMAVGCVLSGEIMARWVCVGQVRSWPGPYELGQVYKSWLGSTLYVGCVLVRFDLGLVGFDLGHVGCVLVRFDLSLVGFDLGLVGIDLDQVGCVLVGFDLDQVGFDLDQVGFDLHQVGLTSTRSGSTSTRSGSTSTRTDVFWLVGISTDLLLQLATSRAMTSTQG